MKKLFIILPICVALGCTDQKTKTSTLKYGAPVKRLVVVDEKPPALDLTIFNE